MRRARRLAAGLGVAAAVLAASGAAHADTVPVAIGIQAYSPSPLQVLVGDAVRWSNASFRNHTVTDPAAGIDSPTILPHGTFEWRFDRAGAYPYYCRLHLFMGGKVDVEPVLLSSPRRVIAAGNPLTLSGRAQPGVRAVEIDGDAGRGYARVATVAVDAHGMFRAVVRPKLTTTYRAVAGTDQSPAVRVAAIDRHVALTARRAGRGQTVLAARVSPAARGLRVVVEAYLRERFGWWPVHRGRTGAGGAVRWTVRLDRRTRLRAVLVDRDGWTAETVSRAIVAGRP